MLKVLEMKCIQWFTDV